MSNLSFEAWLATLSLDAAHSDLCPNLAYIPIRQLRRLWREDCPPSSEAISAHQWKKRAPRPVLPLARISTERLIAEASRRGMSLMKLRPVLESRRERMTREMAGSGHSDAARSTMARSDRDQEMDRRAVDQDEGSQRARQKAGPNSGSPKNEE